MSGCISIQRGQISTWGVYPRVYYFRGRFLDLHRRFNRITGALPEVLHSVVLTTRLRELNSRLENKYINIIVVGKEILAADQLYVCKEQPEDTKTTSHDHTSCLTLIICHVIIDALDEAAVNELAAVTRHVSYPRFAKIADSVDSVLIVCNIKAPFTEEESKRFRTEAIRQVQASGSIFRDRFDILLVSGTGDLSARISAVYEKRIVDAFLCILSYLSLFVPYNKVDTVKKVGMLDGVSIVDIIREFLRNGLSMSDIEKSSFLTDLTSRLVRAVKCSIISPISLKYTLPPWLCNRLLHEIQFEETLLKSVSENSTRYLGKCRRFYLYCKHITQSIRSGKRAPSRRLIHAPKSSTRDLICDLIQEDFTHTIVRAEKVMSSMETLATVMRKMMFEINGYLKQTLVANIQNIQMQPETKIPEILRQEVLLIQGVSGVGTLYGHFEIHINDDNQTGTAEIVHRLEMLMKRHQCQHKFTIRSIKH